jgi:16S rRNA (cytosine967-C5)-methyltransferase
VTARDVAFEALLRVERTDAYLNVALDTLLRENALPKNDSALATELTYGVARRQLALDAALSSHASRALAKVEPAVLVALRLGAYQLFYTRVKDHAAVDETVALVKRQGLDRASGFVNAILRGMVRNRTTPLPEDPIQRLSVEESHPLWLVKRWVARFGESEARALCAADNVPPKVCVRVNAARASREEVKAALLAEGVAAHETPLSPVGLWLEGAGPLGSLAAFRKGLIQAQDEAAQLVSILLSPRPGMRVLDACAAPGGKTCHLAERLAGRGEIVALDLHPRKLAHLSAEARRLGHSRLVHPVAADASRPLPFGAGGFDAALLDAPCSGLGTLRRHPELRYRRREEDIPRLAALQRGLLENVARYVKPGGILVYAVCSMEPEEGEEQVRSFKVSGLLPVPVEASGAALSEVAGPQGIATFPHRHEADGFFAARLRVP